MKTFKGFKIGDRITVKNPDILREKNPTTTPTLRDEYRAHSGKEAIQSGVISPDYMLWLEAAVQSLRVITKKYKRDMSLF